MKITEGMDNIKIAGHRGRWHALESKVYHGHKLWLLEEDTEGDEWPLLVVCENGDCLVDDAWDGWDSLDEAIDGGFVLFKEDDVTHDTNVYVRVGWA